MDTRGRLRNDSANENKEIEVVIKPFEFYFLKKFYDFAFICVVHHSDLVWIMYNVHVVLITLQVLKKESQMARGCSCVWNISQLSRKLHHRIVIQWLMDFVGMGLMELSLLQPEPKRLKTQHDLPSESQVRW